MVEYHLFHGIQGKIHEQPESTYSKQYKTHRDPNLLLRSRFHPMSLTLQYNEVNQLLNHISRGENCECDVSLHRNSGPQRLKPLSLEELCRHDWKSCPSRQGFEALHVPIEICVLAVREFAKNTRLCPKPSILLIQN